MARSKRKAHPPSPAEINAVLWAAKEGNLESVRKWVIDNPALVNATNDVGWTPLHMAAQSGNPDLVEFLIYKDAPVEARDCWDNTPLHNAARTRSARSVELLIHAHSDIHARNKVGMTPLHNAVTGEIAELLIGAGADVNAEWGIGTNTPMIEAILHHAIDVIHVLIAHGAIVTEGAFHLACSEPSPEMVRILLEAGADVNARSLHGETPLHSAVRWGHMNVVEMLIEQGCDINVRTTHEGTMIQGITAPAGTTSLGMALLYKQTAVADLLRRHGGVE